MTVDPERELDRGGDPVAERRQVGRRLEARDDDREFVAADPGHEVLPPHRSPQPRGHRAQQFISGAVTKRVIEMLEIIQVDQEQARFV